jgi:ABC-type Mn2+/Zn2+ transport system permease subunit
LSGEALGWVSWKDIAIMAAFYAVVGCFLYVKRKTLHLCSTDMKKAERQGHSVKLWDFLFYTAFGLVVTDAVRVAGVLAVFSFLIVPIVCATLIGHKGKDRLLWAWSIGIVVSVIGSVLSYGKDWPMGATIVCMFGAMVIVVSLATRMKNAD